MASLRAKDAYLQGLAQKICARPGPEPRERRRAKPRAAEAAGAPAKKRKKAQKSRERRARAAAPPAAPRNASPSAGAPADEIPRERRAPRARAGPDPGRAGGAAAEPESVFALDVLRQRLREKIRQAQGQDGHSELSAATLEKRRRRKQERERRKRKRKELKAREKAQSAGAPAESGSSAAPAPPALPAPEAQGGQGLLFNKVEVSTDEPPSQAQRRREKRARLKGNLTPLTGRNFRQLLERLQARRERVDALREQDAGRARELQARMQWTTLLYKAEGVKIRDDERRLQDALRRKQRRRLQRERAWQRRTARVVQGMQQRQERRRLSLRRRKEARTARRLDKARKKGRVLPQDLERAGLA